MIGSGRIIVGLLIAILSLWISAAWINDSIHRLNRNEEELVFGFRGAAWEDIFGLGFGFNLLVLLVVHSLILLIYRLLVGRTKILKLVWLPIVVAAISVVIHYIDYSREIAMWNSIYA